MVVANTTTPQHQFSSNHLNRRNALHRSSAGFMFYVIERAKKCLDFAATLYIIHLFICIIYGGWPASGTWWVVNIVGLAIMSLLGEYLCIRRELKDIPVRLRPSYSMLTQESHLSSNIRVTKLL
uniref:Uncharacterized protein n=1 Tax=Aegilops tauschii subsp. strangulata TaxID=200361 RepID=A0A453EZR0_AEGTS